MPKNSSKELMIGAILQGITNGLSKGAQLGMQHKSQKQQAKAQQEQLGIQQEQLERSRRAEERSIESHNIGMKNKSVGLIKNLQDFKYITEENRPIFKDEETGAFKYADTFEDVKDSKIRKVSDMFPQDKDNNIVTKFDKRGNPLVFVFDKKGNLLEKKNYAPEPLSGIEKESKENFNLSTYEPTDWEWDKVITPERKRLDQELGPVKKGLNAAISIKSELKANGKLALAVIRTKMPRLFGEVGNLNMAEQKIWGGSPELFNRAKRFILTNLSSKQSLTDEDVKLLQDTVDRATKVMKFRIKQEIKSSIDVSNKRGVSPKYVRSIYEAPYQDLLKEKALSNGPGDIGGFDPSSFSKKYGVK